MAHSSHYSTITNASFVCEINIPYGWSDHLSLSHQEEACCFEQKFGLQWIELYWLSISTFVFSWPVLESCNKAIFLFWRWFLCNNRLVLDIRCHEDHSIIQQIFFRFLLCTYHCARAPTILMVVSQAVKKNKNKNFNSTLIWNCFLDPKHRLWSMF